MISQNAEKVKLQPVLSGGSYLFNKEKKKPQTPTAASFANPAFKPNRKVISHRNTPRAEASRKYEQREKFSRADSTVRNQKQQSTMKISNIVWTVGTASQQSVRGQPKRQEQDKSAKNVNWSSQSKSRKQAIQEALHQKITSKIVSNQSKPTKKSRSPLTISTTSNEPVFLTNSLAKKASKTPSSCRQRDDSSQKQYRSYQTSPSFVLSSFESHDLSLDVDQRSLE